MRYYILFLLFIFSLIIPLSPVIADSTFNPNFIISDHDLQNIDGWSAYEIQKFLEGKNSYLATFRDQDIDGKIKLASEIIYEASIRYNISPKFLLVLLQKEQSLITTTNPSQKQLDWATGYAVCDGCYLNDPKVIKFKGFAKQIEGAAGVMRWYYNNALTQGFIRQKDVPTLINNETVTPQSWATAFLYTYTPHLHGNRNFWIIWNSWFAQYYPNGTLVRSISNDNYYLIWEGQKRSFTNNSALITRADPLSAIPMTEADLSNYSNGPTISLPNYSILKSPSGYFLTDYDYVRPFATEETVRKLGYNPQEIIDITDNDIAHYKRGEIISTNTIAPQGVIWKISDLNNSLYLMKNSTLYPLADPAVVKANFSGLTVEIKKKADLNNFKVAEQPIYFQDGTLLKVSDNGRYFVVEDEKKRRIASEEALLEMGYKKTNVIEINNLIAFHIRDGEPIYISNQAVKNGTSNIANSISPTTPTSDTQQVNNTGINTKTTTLAIDDGSVIKDLAKSSVPSYIIAEYPTGKIISGKNIDTPRSIAAIVKILTANEAFNQKINLNNATIYNSSNHSSYGNPFNLINGEKLSNKDIINTILISSTNNVARMVPTAVNMSEKSFIEAMNKTVKNIGANQTSIVDTTGLSADNTATTRDVLKIFIHSLNNSTIRQALNTGSYTFTETLNKNNVSKHTIKNTNELMFKNNANFKILAGRTGYTSSAGSILALLIESKNNNEQYIIITMGNPDYTNRFKEPERLANWIVANSKNVNIASTETR